VGLRSHLWTAIVPVTAQSMLRGCTRPTCNLCVRCFFMAFTFSFFVWRPCSLGSGRDRTSDVHSPCYVHTRDRLAICVAGGALTRHGPHVCNTGI